jgi:hypothetical protein
MALRFKAWFRLETASAGEVLRGAHEEGWTKPSAKTNLYEQNPQSA